MNEAPPPQRIGVGIVVSSECSNGWTNFSGGGNWSDHSTTARTTTHMHTGAIPVDIPFTSHSHRNTPASLERATIDGYNYYSCVRDVRNTSRCTRHNPRRVDSYRSSSGSVLARAPQLGVSFQGEFGFWRKVGSHGSGTSVDLGDFRRVGGRGGLGHALHAALVTSR